MTYTDAQIEAAAKAMDPDAECWTPRDEFEARERGYGEEIWQDERAGVYLQARLDRYDGRRAELIALARAALAAAEEAGKWEYAWATGPNHTYNWASREEAEEFVGNPVSIRRRPAGPWLPVEGSEG